MSVQHHRYAGRLKRKHYGNHKKDNFHKNNININNHHHNHYYHYHKHDYHHSNDYNYL